MKPIIIIMKLKRTDHLLLIIHLILLRAVKTFFQERGQDILVQIGYEQQQPCFVY